MEIYNKFKSMFAPVCLYFGLLATACSGQPPTDVVPITAPLPPVPTVLRLIPDRRLTTPTPDARWRSNATEVELRGVVENQLRIYNRIFGRSLSIRNIKILPGSSTAAIQWDQGVLTIYRSGIDRIPSRGFIHEFAHADVSPPKKVDPVKFKNGDSILMAKEGVDTKDVQIILTDGFRFQLFGPMITMEKKPDVFQIITNNPTEEAAAEAIAIIADQKQGLFSDTTASYNGNAALFLLWINKNKAIEESISDDAFVSFHQNSDVFPYYERITGIKDDVIYMVSLNNTLGRIMSNEQTNRSQGVEREKMFEKYYKELMALYNLFKQSSPK